MTEWMISSSALIGAMLILRAVVKGRVNPRLQYALWAIVLVRLLCPVSFFDSGLSILNVRQEMMTHPAVQEAYQNFDVPIFADTGRDQTMPELPRESLPAQDPNEKENPTSGANSSPAPQMPAEDPEAVIRQVSVADALMMLWLGGMVLMAAWMIGCNLHFLRRLKKNRQPLSVPDSMLDVYVTDGVETPCLFGLFRPAVYLTPDTVEDPLVKEYVLTHELTHYRQFDHVWSVLRGVALVLHWYNPLAWMAFRASRQDCEMACDEGTLNQLGEAHRGDYGRTLICLATGSSLRNTLVAATTLTGGKQAIRERIVILMKHPRTALITMVCLVLCCALVVGCTFTGALPEKDGIQSMTSLDEVLHSRLYDREKPDVYGVFRLTELDTGTTCQPMEAYLFDFATTAIHLDWENAVSDGSGLFGDATIMVQVESRDGSWYVQYHNGSDAEWIYFSECDLYVPTVPNPDGIPLKTTESYINTHLATEYDSFLWRGWPQTHLGSGTGEDAVSRYWQYLSESKRRTAERSFSGNYAFEDVTLSDHSYRINDDGSVYVSCTLTFFPEEGQELKLYMIDPEKHSFTWDDTLVMLPDGNWYVKDHLNWMPEYDEEDVVQIPNPGSVDSEAAATPEEQEYWLSFFENRGAGGNWYNSALTSVFEDPRDIDLYYYFYSGFHDNEVWADLTEQEAAFLEQAGFHRQMDLQTMPRTRIDEALINTFGLDLAMIRGGVPSEWVYYEANDCYYTNHNDTYAAAMESVDRVLIDGDVTHVVYTLTGWSTIVEDGQQVSPETMVVSLVKLDDGSWRIVSNRRLTDWNEGNTPAELTAEQIRQVNDAFQPFITAQGNAAVLNPLCQFFTSAYASPQELDLGAFLRNFSAEGIVKDWYAQVSDEEFTALTRMENFPFGNVRRQEDLPVPVHKYEAETVDAVIHYYTGVHLDQIPGNGVLYSEAYDAYYNFTSDMGAGIFACTGGVDFGDYVELYSDTMVLTLVKQGDRYLIYSYLPISGSQGTELTDEEIQQVNEAFDFIRWEENGEYHMATNPVSGFFTSYYASPEEINLEDFLRYFSAYGIVDYEDSVSEEEFWALKEIVGDEYPFRGVEGYEDAVAKHTPIHRIPYDAVDAVIGYYTGIALADLTDMRDLPVTYLEEYDCFYNFTSDYGPGVFQCVGGVDYGDYVELYSAHSILTLKVEGLRYYIVSYLPRE